jgi:hypothetical protein
MSNVRYPQLADRDWLAGEYVDKGRSCADIAAEVGCTASNVDLRLRQLGVPRRGRGQRTTLREKMCVRCKQAYQPNGPAQRMCDGCWSIKKCQECGREFQLSAEERSRHRPGRKLCDECCASARGAPTSERWAVGREQRMVSGEFTCRDCGGQFPESGAVSDGSRISGHTERCRGCESARGAGHRFRKFGATTDDYARLLAEQEGCCAICGYRAEPGGAILRFDHDHKRIRPRGLLCHPCNVALGWMADDPSRLRAAADYLELWSAGEPIA